MVYRTSYTHPEFGEVAIASDGQSIVGLWMAGQKHFGGTVDGEMVPADDLPVFAQAKDWLERYFAGKRPATAELPLAPNGTAFRQRVWRKLAEIPYGCVRTYGDLAREIAQEDGKEKMSSQAVGGAVGHNPISIIIPCHRVVGANGSLTGYAGGLTRKIWLLEHEGVDMEAFFVPKKGTAL
ncbi:methylated-DNA--[protein]-cysteine S-methyltransferase [Gordonibacter urolithinfaciens]|uniref:Methylated-DNA--protein-cysteine methyltransferase n=1 Tax=Gordonibacter urolithinfaciens TaxID=1335613 RepID=A0A6N8IIF2_9ACTN|nr:methylated-DNA--[protein]-cysteine S-methyltransferase [Gordonibacter urolithinfaciens]MVM53325.1 methylated-DNA--[protein]-cysteine S-methyltransferase [Gordonibacter urolithinfaciens]MVN15522.1 methylated-DNA--[protein]-cysteine S-methyltransferase [Gordonibacter urolithinfaciens]MVN39653.1 methylated-DNA--[protein]-cysteine S-methyltransferase [Gordonibacter urolithinfaciens]MVN55460.1 methylated-DNA--[protein]-cysteine S-methyltransferase [Gordonibacter urolithinfaciens]MVN60087.1 methy